MTAMIMLMLWGTMSEEERHSFLVRLLALEASKSTNMVHESLVLTVEHALANEAPDDEILEKLLEVMNNG